MKPKILIVLFCLLLNSYFAKLIAKEIQNEKHDFYITQDEINNLGEMKVGDFMYLVENNIPISPKNKNYKNVLSEIKNSKGKIIFQDSNVISVKLLDMNKGEKDNKIMEILYIFEDDKLIKGPLIKKSK